MYRIVQSMLKSDSDCADAILESILKAYKSIRTLKEPNHFKTWLIRILINECNRILNFKNKIIPVAEMTEVPLMAPMIETFEIHEIISSLVDDLRIVATLYYFEDIPGWIYRKKQLNLGLAGHVKNSLYLLI